MWPVYVIFLILCQLKNCDSIKSTGSCKCELDNGERIDLSKLAKKGGSPRFVDIPDQGGGDAFSYNPCKPFSEGACTDVAVCQTRGTDQYNTGDQKDVQCLKDDNGVSLVYTSNSPVLSEKANIERTTVVYLKCDSTVEGDLQVQGEITDKTYLMFLTSKYACPFKPGLSAGTIIIIIFICCLFTYFIGGLLYQSFYKKATGKERIPNYNLWINLPSLVKDGSMFVIGKVKNTGYSKV